MESGSENNNLGREVRITFEGCNQDILNSPDILRGIVHDICRKLNVEIRSETCHVFDPQGVSVVAILAESHCALHTWPENRRGTATIDIFTCGLIDPVVVIPIATRALRAESSSFTVTERAVTAVPKITTYPGFPEYILTAPPYGHFPKPVFRRGVGREYLLEPEGLAWARFFTSNEYSPPQGKDILLLHPCSWAKPYDFSDYISRLRKITDNHSRIHRVIISNVGLVPFEYQMNEFFCSYDYMDTSGGDLSRIEDPRELYRKLTAERIGAYISANKSRYKAIILLGHPVSHGHHEAVSKAAREVCLLGFQAPRLETYRSATLEINDDCDIDAPLFTPRSLNELSQGIISLEKELDKGKLAKNE